MADTGMTMLRRLQRAYGLVEMMVALAIGMLILAASVALMVNSKQAYTTQDSLARLQENARFAMQFLMHDIRMAGYYGCANDITSVKSWLTPGSSFQFNMNDRIEGSESGGHFYPSDTAVSTVLAGTGVVNGETIWPHTDAITLRMLDASNPISLQSNMPQQSASMKVNQNSGLNAGDVVMLSDCSSADMFQITNMNANGSFDLVVHNTGGSYSPGNDPANNPMKLSKRYQAGAQIMKFQSITYFIAGSTSDPTRPALYRQSLVTQGGVSQPTNLELVEGIESLQITYGVDTNGDRVPDYYTTADVLGTNPTNWSSVVAVRVGILATTLTNDSTPGSTGKQSGTDFDTQTYDVNGYSWPGSGDRPAGDRRERRVFISTIIPRNLQ